jgi:hypothetical protein
MAPSESEACIRYAASLEIEDSSIVNAASSIESGAPIAAITAVPRGCRSTSTLAALGVVAIACIPAATSLNVESPTRTGPSEVPS